MCDPSLALVVLVTKCMFAFSPLEFHIRKEEFLTLVLAGQQLQALSFAREQLAPVSTGHSDQLMRLMGALAFPNLKEAPEE